MANERVKLHDPDGNFLGTIDAEEWSSFSSEQKQAFIEKASKDAGFAPPTERFRSAMQGLTLGAYDEIASAIQNPISAFQSLTGDSAGGKAYEDTLKNERDVLARYRKNYPYSSLGWEVGGAALPVAASLLAAPFTGGASTEVAAAPTVGRVASVINGAVRGAKTGAITGGIYGFNSGEGGVVPRSFNAAKDAVTGGVGGAVVGGGVSAVGNVIFKPAMDWIRQKAGDRMAGAVSAEIQRLAQEGGLTPDEVIDGVARGRLMAENKTLGLMIRKFYSEGGEAAALIRNRLDARPAETRSAAMNAMQNELADAGNPLANKRASDEAARLAESDAYKSAFDQMPAVPDNVVAMLQMVAKDAPEALSAAAKAARLKYGVNPFFTEEDGQIVFTRTPSLAEAESTYRALRDLANKSYKEGSGDIGEGYGLYRDTLKTELDKTSDALKGARTEAAIVRHANDFFKLGQVAAGKSPDELELIMKQIAERDLALGTDEGIKAFRAGLVASLRGQLVRPSSAPLVIRNLANPETGQGTALRMALPDGADARVIPKLEVAADAQAAQKRIIEGSQTAPTTLNERGIGDVANVASDAAQGMSGDMNAWARLITGLIGNKAPSLSEAQRLEIARIVLSEDPKLVERALKDNSLVGELEKGVMRALDKVKTTGSRAAPIAIDGLLSDRGPR